MDMDTVTLLALIFGGGAGGVGIKEGIGVAIRRWGSNSSEAVQQSGTTDMDRSGIHSIISVGEERPVSLAECRANHEALQAKVEGPLANGHTKFEKHATEIRAVSDSVQDLRGDMREGLQKVTGGMETGFARMETVVLRAVDEGIKDHRREDH